VTAPEPTSDAAARRLITDTGLHRTLFVEAGAGSGKTTQLVERIANLVVREGVRLSDIAAITFTEAAAAELQSKVRVRFEREARETADPDRRARCEAAIADADLAAISTLHGFASRLLGEFSIDAHLPPRVTVLDEVSSQLAHEDRWARFVDRLYADPQHHELLLRAVGLDIALEQRYPGQATFRDVADVLAQNWDRIDVIAATAPEPLAPLDLTAIDAAIDAIAALPSQCTDPDDKFLGHLLVTVLPQLEQLVEVDDPARRLHLARSLRIGPGNGGRNAAWNGDVTAPKATVKSFGAAVDSVMSTVVDPVLKHLLVLTAREVLDAAHARRDEGGLEFHDLLVLGRELLRTSPGARSALHDRYRCLLLDEFQDTDPLQIDLATLIAATVAPGTPGSWDTLEVEAGRLFFVGDPKQSIYRFRRADIELFLSARDRFGGADRVGLVTNFRTVEPILDWVNDLFAAAMPDEVPGAQPAYERLEAVRAPSPDGDHRPVLLGGPHPDPKVLAPALREAEAADVADVLADIRDHPDAWPVFDRDTGAWRAARLSDVTVLVPTRTSLPYLRRSLATRAVPYRLATGTLVYDTQEVRDVLSALRAVDDPTDELSLVAALRSPLFACSDADLFTFHHAGGHWNFRAPVPPAVPDDHPVRAAFADLEALWRLRWWQGPADLVEALLRGRQADLLAFGDPRPKEVWRRLRFLVDQARSFEESVGGGLRAFLEWATLQGADGARVHEPMLAETDDDAVGIMTVHGAKGLEFPITVLSGMTTRPGGTRPGVSVLWGEADLPELRVNAHVATADHEPRADIEQAMDRHEKLRLLYVATTRARDHLVVSCHHKAGDAATDTYAARIWRFFCGDDDPDVPDDHRVPTWRSWTPSGEGDAPPAPPLAAPDVAAPDVAAPEVTAPEVTVDPPPVDPPADDRASWVRRRADLIDPQRRSSVTSATAIAARAQQIPEAAIEGDALDVTADADAEDGPVRRKGRTGSAVGRAVHATLELVDLADPADVRAHVEQQCELEAIADLADTVESMVVAALASPAVRLAAESPHHKEMMVTAPVGDAVIEGYIDLLVERPDGLVVVDYKTDSARSEAEIAAALDRYELQGAAYAVALEVVTGRPVVDCRFVFCNPGGAVERSVRDLRGATARVRASLA